MSTTMIIRTLTEVDNRILDDIEARSDRTFLKLPGFEKLIQEPRLAGSLSLDSHAGALLMIAETEVPIGYVFARDLDDCSYIAQLSVVPEAQGIGAGTALLKAVAGAARQAGKRGVTLITFKEIPWNAPYYRRRGFHVLAQAEMGPGLSAEVEQDADHVGRYGTRCPMGLFFKQ